MLDMTPEVQFALAAVRQASWLARRVQRELAGQSLAKADRSPVTVADFAAQAVAAYLLRQHFPQDVLVAEESAAVLRQPENAGLLARVVHYVQILVPLATPEAVCDWIDHGAAMPADRFWVLDPIDGTKGFLRGDQYAVALALVDGGQVQIGVLGCPNLRQARILDHDGPGSLVVATRGQGAWVAPLVAAGAFEPLAVSAQTDPTRARVLRSFESSHTNTGQVEAFARALKVTAEPVCLDSQAKYALLAAGAGELMVRLLSPDRPDYGEKIWDQAAGSLIVEEAGVRWRTSMGPGWILPPGARWPTTAGCWRRTGICTPRPCGPWLRSGPEAGAR